MIPGSLAVMSAAAAPAPAGFDPATLFAAGEKGAWYDAAAWATTAFQDTAGSTAVTAAGQPVGRLLDRSGRGNHLTQSTSGFRPTLEIVSGKAGVLGDGVDDLMTASVDMNAVIGSAGEFFDTFVVFRYNNVTSSGAFGYQNNTIVGDEAGYVELAWARVDGIIGFSGGSGGGNNATINTSVTAIHVAHARFNGSNFVVSIDGGAETSVANTFGVSNSAGTMRLFRGFHPSNADARFHEIIIRGAAMTSTQRTDCINYLKTKWGVA